VLVELVVCEALRLGGEGEREVGLDRPLVGEEG